MMTRIIALCIAAAAAGPERGIPRIRWTVKTDAGRPDLGLPVLEDLRTHTLYRAAPATGTYSHHGYITAHDGTLFATWSNHARDEDAPGQRVLASRSTDGGKTWAPFSELFGPFNEVTPGAKQDNAKDIILIANGFATVGGTLYAVAEPHVLAGPRSGWGRVARSICADGDAGPIFWLVRDHPAPRPGCPAYPDAADPRFAGPAEKIRAYLARPEHWPSWEFHRRTSRPTAADGHRLCEPTQAWRLADGTYVRLYRDLGMPRTKRNYAQFGFDGGAVWTAPVKTPFPDACSRSAAGTLPGGAAYVINNPGRGRDPLVVSLAPDGLHFDRAAVIRRGAPKQRYPGRWKGQGFQYPHAVVFRDDLWVIYSVNKEDVQVTRIPLAKLRSLKPAAAAEPKEE